MNQFQVIVTKKEKIEKKEDFKKVEDKIIELARRSAPFVRKDISKADSIDYFEKKGDEYKLELIDGYWNLKSCVGYKLINEKKPDIAKVVLELNAKMHPDDYNVWDSLGEIYMVLGENQKAIQSYRKSLELYSGNTNAEEMIQKIEVK